MILPGGGDVIKYYLVVLQQPQVLRWDHRRGGQARARSPAYSAWGATRSRGYRSGSAPREKAEPRGRRGACCRKVW